MKYLEPFFLQQDWGQKEVDTGLHKRDKVYSKLRTNGEELTRTWRHYCLDWFSVSLHLVLNLQDAFTQGGKYGAWHATEHWDVSWAIYIATCKPFGIWISLGICPAFRGLQLLEKEMFLLHQFCAKLKITLKKITPDENLLLPNTLNTTYYFDLPTFKVSVLFYKPGKWVLRGVVSNLS